MKIISPTLHGYLDYLTVLIFFVAPMQLGLTGLAATIAYALAGIHLLVTLLTSFPLGIIKIIPFKIHGWIERLVGLILVLLPFALGFIGVAQGFYVGMGIIIILATLLTDYQRS